MKLAFAIDDISKVGGNVDGTKVWFRTTGGIGWSGWVDYRSELGSIKGPDCVFELRDSNLVNIGLCLHLLEHGVPFSVY